MYVVHNYITLHYDKSDFERSLIGFKVLFHRRILVEAMETFRIISVYNMFNLTMQLATTNWVSSSLINGRFFCMFHFCKDVWIIMRIIMDKKELCVRKRTTNQCRRYLL